MGSKKPTLRSLAVYALTSLALWVTALVTLVMGIRFILDENFWGAASILSLTLILTICEELHRRGYQRRN